GLNKTSSLLSTLPLAILNSINSSLSTSYSVILFKETETSYYNATAQKNSLAKQEDAEEQLKEFNLFYNIACDPKRHHDFLIQITETKQEIDNEKKTKIKAACSCTSKRQAKKHDTLENRGDIIHLGDHLSSSEF
ncbi:43892_t:CDS:1, partial [Gigaspora margarita]